MQPFVINNEQIYFPVEIIRPSDPRTKSQKCKEIINNEISGLLARRAFQYVERNKLPEHANILGEIFLQSIKTTRSGR